jgi:hypothetical protein
MMDLVAAIYSSYTTLATESEYKTAMSFTFVGTVVSILFTIKRYIELTSSSSDADESAYLMGEASYEARAEWTRAERPLDDADADVLIILDCCSAANIIKKGGPAIHRCHELFAAVGRNKRANRPGDESFTRHFIDALKEQLHANDRQPFTTFELHDAIVRRKQDFQSSLTHRHGGTRTGRHISLAPLDQLEEDVRLPPAIFRRTGNTATLDLRLVFRTDSMLEDQQIDELATKLSQAAKTANDNSNMGLQSIEWVEYQPSASAVLIRILGRHQYLRSVYLKKWLKKYRARRKRKAEREEDQETPKKRVVMRSAEDMLTPNSLASRHSSPS